MTTTHTGALDLDYDGDAAQLDFFAEVFGAADASKVEAATVADEIPDLSDVPADLLAPYNAVQVRAIFACAEVQEAYDRFTADDLMAEFPDAASAQDAVQIATDLLAEEIRAAGARSARA